MAAAEIQGIISIGGAMGATDVLMAAKVAKRLVNTTQGHTTISALVLVFQIPL